MRYTHRHKLIFFFLIATSIFSIYSLYQRQYTMVRNDNNAPLFTATQGSYPLNQLFPRAQRICLQTPYLLKEQIEKMLGQTLLPFRYQLIEYGVIFWIEDAQGRTGQLWIKTLRVDDKDMPHITSSCFSSKNTIITIKTNADKTRSFDLNTTQHKPPQ